MTQQFEALFSRYDSLSGQARLTSPVFIFANDFAEAAKQADLILRGMAGADPLRSYAIAEISGTRNLRAIKCDGARMFETGEELTARVAGEKK